MKSLFPLIAAIAFASACGGEDTAASVDHSDAEQREIETPNHPVSAPAPVENAFTLVLLGDSLTAGFGLENPDALVDALALEVGSVAGEPVAIVNAGVSGDTASGALARFDFSVPDKADGVLIELGANDMFQQRPPVEIASDIALIVEKAQERDLWVGVVGMRAPLNAGPAYKEAFDALYPDLALHYCVALYDFYFTGVIDPGTGETREELMLPDLLHPNADGVAVVAANMGPWLRHQLNSDEDPC